MNMILVGANCTCKEYIDGFNSQKGTIRIAAQIDGSKRMEN